LARPTLEGFVFLDYNHRSGRKRITCGKFRMPQDIDYAFGNMAVGLGYLRQEELEDGIEVLVALERAGSGKRLWEVVARKGYMKPSEVEEVLGRVRNGTLSSVDTHVAEAPPDEEAGEGPLKWDISLDTEVQPVTDPWGGGESDASAGPAPQEEVSLGPGKVRLRCVRGPEAGKVFVLGKTKTLIGRDAHADIVLADASASRRHAEVVMGKRRVVVRDLGSRNGVYVNRVLVKESVLRFGEKLRVGKCVLVMEKVEGAGEEG